jgi:hypothetical protein
MQSLSSPELSGQADLCLLDTRLGALLRTAHDRTVAGLEDPTRSSNGGLLELGTKGLYERKVAVPDTRFRLYNAYWRIGRSGLAMESPFSTNYR